MQLNVYYVQSSSGRPFVKDYIASLDANTQYEVYAFISKFQHDSRYRQEPYSKKVHQHIFELRIKVRDHYRILYAFVYRDSVVLLHMFKKKTNKIPKRDIQLAIKRLQLYEN